MTRYEHACAAVAAALEPVAAYVERAHATTDAADPAHAGRRRHLAHIEALVEAVADFGAVVDPRMSGPDWRRIAFAAVERWAPPPAAVPAWVARCQAFLDSPRMQARAALPLAERRRLAAITSYDLPVPAHILAVVSEHARPL